jgi:predicted dehydrogenase
MERLARLAGHLQTAETAVPIALSSTPAAGERKTRYAVVGLGGRSVMYSGAILSTYADRAELVGICDINADRMAYYLREWESQYGKGGDIPMYDPSQFEQMLEENQVDTVIVTTMDRTHHRYIIRAMKAGCDAITEKPMTVDEEKCQQILDTIEETGRSLRVTFNYRYAPRASKVKELIMAGTVSTVLQCPPGLISLRYVFDTCTYCADRRDQIGAL